MRSIRRRLSKSRRSAPSDPGRRAFLATAATAAVAGCATAGDTDLNDITRPTGQFVSVGDTRLHYRILGSGPKAIAIHGASGNLRDWTIGPGIKIARTHQLLVFDRPGLGFSDRAPSDGDNPFIQARLMRQAAGLLGFDSAIVIGHSFGGSVALAWALDAPDTVDGLLLISAPSQVWDGGVGLLYDLAGNPVTGPLFSRLLPAVASDRFIENAVGRIFAPQEPPQGYVRNVGANLALRPRNVRANAADVGSLKGHIRRMVPRYPELDLRVELLHGTADDTVPARIHSDKLIEQLPNARYTRLEGIGHMPHHVSTDAMLDALARLTG